MGLSRNKSLDLSDEFGRRQRERLKEAGLSIDLDDEDDAQYTYEMALKKRSVAGLLSQAMREQGGKDATKGIKWRKRRVSEDEE